MREISLLRKDTEFRFLDLPADLRLMVYEFLPTCLTHNKIIIETQSKSGNILTKDTEVTLVMIWHPTVIRLTCKLIREEATTVVVRTAAKSNMTTAAGDLPNKTLSSSLSPKAIVPFKGLEVIVHKGGPLDAALQSLSWALEARKTGSKCVTAATKDSSSGPDSLILANWARQAGWHLAQMSPQTRAIEIVIDQTQLSLPGEKASEHLEQYDFASLCRFEKNVEKFWRRWSSQQGNMPVIDNKMPPNGKEESRAISVLTNVDSKETNCSKKKI